MIRVIARQALPPDEAASGRRLADPDLLLAIAERFAGAARPDAALGDEFSHVLHDLRMGGTWKRTNRGRLPVAERTLAAHLAPPPDGEVTVLDLGASDGVTTLDLAAALKRHVANPLRIYMTDVNLFLLRFRNGPVREYRAAGGEPIMVRLGRLGLRLAAERLSGGATVDPVARLYLACAAFRRAMRLDARIPLVHPLVGKEPAITTMELDCLVRNDELIGRMQAVRACNVLNLAYFSTAQLRAIAGHVHAYLKEGGVFLVSRNHDEAAGETENGSVWRKGPQRFVHLADFGVGSEIKATVNEWTAP